MNGTVRTAKAAVRQGGRGRVSRSGAAGGRRRLRRRRRLYRRGPRQGRDAHARGRAERAASPQPPPRR